MVVFKQGIVDVEEILMTAHISAWLRLKYGSSPFSFTFSDWILNPDLCLQSSSNRGVEGFLGMTGLKQSLSTIM